MPTRALAPGSTVQTSLKSWGTSRGIRIPKRLCEWMGIVIGSDLTISPGTDAEGSFIVVRPANSGHRSFSGAPFISMEEAFAGYGGSYVPVEADWGPDEGAANLLRMC